MAGGSKCQDVSSHPIAVGVVVAVQKVGGGISGTLRRIFQIGTKPFNVEMKDQSGP